MTDIVLTTMNARYGHTAFGLRYLQANLGSLSERSKIIEFDLQKTPEEAAARIAEEAPSIVGIGAHIWNASRLPAWIQGLRTRLPSVRIVLGGPEVGFDDHADWAGLCDYMIAGEADQAFAELCRQLLNGAPPPGPLIKAPPPDLAELARPYSLYSDEDLAHRTLYVETSRGCPFTCEYCLSSVERSVRFFPLPGLFDDFRRLMDRGARHFKFVDRTFNLNIPHCLETLQFFLLEFRPGLFLHIEAIPDRLPQELRDILLRFPPASLQVEAGIQTWNPEIAARIQRKQDPPLLESNLRFLRESTSAYIHADLIAGLPGESLESFASGFDRLAALRPHEIQVGILKKLRGTAIGRHDAEWGMIYQTAPPYALKCNKQLSAEDMAAIHRFAHFWDSLYNSGHFIGTLPLLWKEGGSPFRSFMELSEQLRRHFGRDHAIALDELARQLFDHLISHRKMDPGIAGPSLARDYQWTGKQRLPAFLKPFEDKAFAPSATFKKNAGLQRQLRHFNWEAIRLKHRSHE